MTTTDPRSAHVAARRLARNLRLAYGALPVQQLSILVRTPRMTLLEVAEAAVRGEMRRQGHDPAMLDAHEVAAAVLEAIGAKMVDPRRAVSPD